MQIPSHCFVLAVAISIGTSTTAFSQESVDDPRLEQMQATIVKLQAELDSLKQARASGPVPTLAAPEQLVGPAELAPPQRGTLRTPTLANPPANYYSHPQPGYRGGSHPPVYNQYGAPPIEPAFVQQPQVIFVEPAYLPNTGYGDYGGGYGGGGFYVGPNGWGIDLGGLRLDFHDHGRQGHNGHGHGHRGHRGRKKH